MTPIVTVLIAAYNGGEHLRAAVASVLGQTEERFELIVVDDCSTDDSVAVVESFDDPRIRLFRNERNLGQVPSLNRGLREARGTFVARLDQDDACLPARLERQAAVLEQDPRVAVVGCFMRVVDADGRPVRSIERRLDDRAEFVFLALRDRLPLFHSCVMFRRDAVLARGGYDETLALAEDTDLWRRLALARHGTRVVPEHLVTYQIHAGQQSLARRDRQVESNTVSHERFLGAFGDRLPARLLRLALTEDATLWDEIRTSADARRLADALGALVGGVEQRLALDSGAAAKFRRLVAEHVGRFVLGSWRRGPLPYWRTAPALAHGGCRQKAALVALMAAAPLLRPLLLAKRRLRPAHGLRFYERGR